MNRDDDPQAAARHPVRLVAERTGLSPHVLRVWERRYGAVHPTRSAGGQRLYSDADIARLRLLHVAVQAGRNVGQVAGLTDAELERLIESDREADGRQVPPPAEPVAAAAERWRREALAAVGNMDPVGLDAVLRRAVSLLGATAFTDDVVVPLLGDIGWCWRRGELSPAHEHLASAVLRRVLDDVREAFRPSPGAPAIVVATPPGQLHEMGALLAAATAAAHGWRVVYLGTDLPAADIARAVAQVEARAVGLSLVHPEGDARTADAVAALVAILPADCALALGGAAAGAYHARLPQRSTVRHFPSLAGLRELLAASDGPTAPAGE